MEQEPKKDMEPGKLFNEEKAYNMNENGVQITRKQTIIERDVSVRADSAKFLAKDLIPDHELAKHHVSAYMPHVRSCCC